MISEYTRNINLLSSFYSFRSIFLAFYQGRGTNNLIQRIYKSWLFYYIPWLTKKNILNMGHIQLNRELPLYYNMPCMETKEILL